MVTGSVIVRLGADDHHDRHRLDVLGSCPDNAVVRVDIGARNWVSLDAAVWLHAHADRLIIEIVGQDPLGVRRFVDAARVGLEAVLS